MTRNALSSMLVPVLSVALAVQPSVVYGADNQGVASDHSIHDGTPIKLRLRENVSSSTARTGQEVPFETVDEVQVDGVTVLPKGSTAIAVVTESESKRTMGRAGKLNMAIGYARLKDGNKIALRAVREQKGSSHTGAMTGAMVATSLIVWPAAPFFLFMKGKDITIPQGTEITAFVDGDMHLDMAKFGAADASGVAPASQTSLSLDSTPAAADNEVDGNFVGQHTLRRTRLHGEPRDHRPEEGLLRLDPQDERDRRNRARYGGPGTRSLNDSSEPGGHSHARASAGFAFDSALSDQSRCLSPAGRVLS